MLPLNKNQEKLALRRIRAAGKGDKGTRTCAECVSLSPPAKFSEKNVAFGKQVLIPLS